MTRAELIAAMDAAKVQDDDTLDVFDNATIAVLRILCVTKDDDTGLFYIEVSDE